MSSLALQPTLGLFTRYVHNPIIDHGHWPYPVEAVINPGVAVYNNETIMLCRVADCRGLSWLQVARSHDGVTNWRIDPEPLIIGDPNNPAELWGTEDPRITWMQELNCWVIAYTTYGPVGASVSLATTTDFKTITRYGSVLPPEDKDAALMPRRINGEFIMIHRPVMYAISNRADIRLSRSKDLKTWSESEPVLQSRLGVWWDSARIGLGPPVVETSAGWLMMYHGVRTMVNGVIYRVGLALLDKDDPTHVLRRSDEWIFGPEEMYERVGNVPNVVFPTGWVVDEKADEIRMYYGMSDTSIGLATARFSHVMNFIQQCPQPASGNADDALRRSVDKMRSQQS
jgi:predicted GH43/DUF377 family glycosyl hydrolase